MKASRLLALFAGLPVMAGLVLWSAARPPGVVAAGDPVIAAAGDIACDPANSSFKQGEGTSNACRQRQTSDILFGAGLAAVLPQDQQLGATPVGRIQIGDRHVGRTYDVVFDDVLVTEP